MKKVILVYLIFSLNFFSFDEILRTIFNKSYKGYYKLEINNDKLIDIKEYLNIKNLDYNMKNSNIRSETKMIVIHHCARKTWDPEEINNFHKSKGWDGIGYNFYIRKDGSIYNGRGEEAIGAQLKGYNHISIGICLEGNFEIEEVKEEQLNSLNDLIYYLVRKYEIKKIVGHRDYGETLCPGNNLDIKKVKENLIKKIKSDI